MTRKRVVVYKRLPAVLLDELRDEFEVAQFDEVGPANHADFVAAVRHAHGLVGASVRLPAEILEPARQLQIISTISVGVDAFDVGYLTGRGIMLAHTPDILTDSTADAIFALMLATARRIVELAELVKAGGWTASIGDEHYGVDVHSKCIGILGMGRIGCAVARRAHLGFGMTVRYHNRSAVPWAENAVRATRVPLDALLAESDFVCVVLPLTPQTERMIGARELGLMRPDAILVNASRGRVVDEAALVEALGRGTIRGAGLDVFEREPLPADSPLLTMPNVVALPHLGSATRETRFAMARLAVDNLVAGLRGERPRHLANGG